MTKKVPVSAIEGERLKALFDYNVLDTLPEEELDAITRLASYICQTPIALISLLDGERQWFKSKVGLDAAETAREVSFCQYAIMGKDIFEVPNALEDERFRDNPLVTGNPDIRFYAGVPLENPDGLNLGSLCVIDQVPRTLTAEQKEALKVLSRQVMVHFELRKQNELLRKDREELNRKRKMLQALAAATDDLLSNPDFYQAVSDSLPLLAEAVGADTVCLFKNSFQTGKEPTSAQLLRWDALTAKLRAGQAELQEVPLAVFEQQAGQQPKHQPVQVVLSQLAAGAVQRQAMEMRGVKSMLAIPVVLKDTAWGFLAFGDYNQERVWTEPEIPLLKSYANSIANAIDRADIAEAIYNMALFPMENPEPVFRINLDGELFLKNKAAERIDHFWLQGTRHTDLDFYRLVARQVSQQQPVLELEAGHGQRIYQVVARLLGQSNYINIYTHDITSQKETERELERLSMVAKANTKGVLFINRNGAISWCNEGFRELTRYKGNDIFLNDSLDLFRGKFTQPEKLQELSTAFKKGEALESEQILYRKDKSFFWANVKLQPLKDAQNQVQEFFAMVEDIDEKKKAEELLQESESRMKALVQSLHAGLLLKDEKRKVILANNEFYQLFNLPASVDLTGKEYVKISEQLHPLFKNPAAYIERTEEILQANQTVLEEVLELADGRFLERDYIPIFIDNTYKGHLWKYTDVTERKNYEKNLKAQEEKYRSIITNMNLGLIEVDMGGVIQSANLTFCRDSGYRLDEVVGRKAAQLLGLKQLSRNSMATKPDLLHLSENTQVPVLNKRGELRWWLLSSGPNYDEAGEQKGAVIINLDITGHKKLEEELILARQSAEDSARAKDRFFATISHEIRTPLNAIIGMVKELSKDRLTGQQKLYLRHAGSASQHLLSLVNNILDFSKIEAGEFQLEKRTFSLKEVVADTSFIMSPAAKEKLLDFKISVADTIAPALVGDPNRIRQILINLISNAIKFTEKGQVSLQCESAGKNKYSQQLKITITDTGIGMEKTYLNNIFQKFSQEDVSTARKYGGTGLGMPITYELVQLMNGTIKVSSKRGKGTRVEILLNLEIGNEKEIERATEAVNFEKLKNKKVLLVEDNEMNRMVAFNTLKRYEMLITEAVNGREAVEILKESEFDLILMDLQMPVMDGIEATGIIRDELKITTPIIAFTANAFKNDIEQYIAVGMNDYVTKPFEEKVLIGTIQNALGLTASQSEDVAPLGGNEEQKLYSLSKLFEVSHGDTEFVKRMLNVFKEHTAASVQEIKEALAASDYDKIRKVAHRIKPGIEKLEIVALHQDIRLLEQFNPGTYSHAALQEAVAHLETVVNKVITALAEEVI